MIVQVAYSHQSIQLPKKKTIGKIAIVGGGIAGMLAALACQPYANSIRMLERDADRAVGERSELQDGYGYALVSGGLDAIRRLSPQLYDELVSNGAGFGDALANVSFFEEGISSPTVNSDLSIMTVSRGYIRRTIRSHIQRYPNITIEQADVQDVIPAGDQALVKTKDLEATFDLVIDASGRRSTSERSRAFADAFYSEQKPKLRIYEPDVRIRSAILEESEPSMSGLLLLIGSVPPPDGLFGCQLMRLEDGKLQVAVAERRCNGVSGVSPEEIIAACLPASFLDTTVAAVSGKVFKPQRYRYAYRMEYPSTMHPCAFLTIGDANMSTNPIYGLGIASAAMAAFELRSALELAIRLGKMNIIVPAYFAGTRRSADLAWKVSSWTDKCYGNSKSWFSWCQAKLQWVRSRIIHDPGSCRLLFAGAALHTKYTFEFILFRSIFIVLRQSLAEHCRHTLVRFGMIDARPVESRSHAGGKQRQNVDSGK